MTMTDQERLEMLRASRDALLTGKRVATVSSDGTSVGYSQGASLGALNAEIRALEVKLGLAPRRRPLRPRF
jgi:hypothetical protein